MIVGESTPVLVQGITGAVARRHTASMLAYGTRVVAGVTPGRGGETAGDIPVFDTVAEAVAQTGATASVAFLPPAIAASGIVEAADAGIDLMVCVSEGMPVHDTVRALAFARSSDMRVIGPNTAGVLVPRSRTALGFLPSDIAEPGQCAVVSKSGTLSYEVVSALGRCGVGVSAWVAVGGDRVKGSTFAELLPLVLDDPDTRALVLIGEIGGTDEEAVASLLREQSIPVAALIAGRTVPPGVTMGHAGAIVGGNRGSYASKASALSAVGAHVVATPLEVGRWIAGTLR